MDPAEISEKITDVALKCTAFDVIEAPKIGEGDWKNEFLFFMKPEVFMFNDAAKTRKLVRFLVDMIGRYDAAIDGVCAVNGSVLEKYSIMSAHYGFINAVSTGASKIVDQETKAKIAGMYYIPVDSFEVLGGHEYLERFGPMTPDQLDVDWFMEKSLRVRSGFYTRLMKKDGKNIILVNGFHPNQLAYYTNPDHRIVLLLLHSNRSWADLKNKMVGATFPEKSDPESMRGILFAHAKEYGFEKVDVSNNCMHLSAGPFEAMLEINNFFGKLLNVDMKTAPPNVLRKMMAQGISYEDGIRPLKNPPLNYNGKDTDLFSATEEKETEEAIRIFRENVLKR